MVDEPRVTTVEDHVPRGLETDAAVGVTHEIEFDDARLRIEEWPVTM